MLEAWDEPHQQSPVGDASEGSLHYEGRTAKVDTSDGDNGKLARLSQLAICAGIDAVQRNSKLCCHIGLVECQAGNFKNLCCL